MSRRKRTENEVAAKRLQEGIDLLSEGRGADVWVCREVLGLTGEVTYLELVAALHDRIHEWNKLPSNRERKMMSASIKAAAILLNLVM